MPVSSKTFRVVALLLCTKFALTIVAAQIAEEHTQNPCSNKRTCHECIQIQGCAWCMQPDFGDSPRCFQPSYETMNVCPKNFIWNPDNEQIMITNHILTRAGVDLQMSNGDTSAKSSAGSSAIFGTAGTGIVQISPQNVNLKLRINQPHRLHFRYSQAQDYPVDLYYIMDLSKSMKKNKDKLSKLGDLLSDTMRNMTSNFRLGFGSFVDKVLMPYVSKIPRELEQPGERCDYCEDPYGYRNHMPLSVDTATFSDEVKRAAVSKNLDASEGGFDAIMQAIVCRDKIGWRDQARRMLVFSTDAEFHLAGDGKMGGVLEPNDGKCHLDDRGFYTHSSIQDYPSISQINHFVKKNSINIIFAITEQQINIYEKLSHHIEGSSSAILSRDSSNVVELVREEYGKISSSIKMKDNASSFVKITYYSSCLNGGTPIPTVKCDGLKVGDVVSFTAEIVVTSCPNDPTDWHQLIQIYPVGINESLVIDLEMLCSCPCEQLGHPEFEAFSSKCHSHGQYKCGICECDDAHSGRNCECSMTDINADNEADLGCPTESISQAGCSGRGNCVCGVCECEKRSNPNEVISGKFCECDNFSCERHNQLLCSGPDHGTCECGACVCKYGWTGSACECRASNDTCISPGSREICSGHGICECGSCICEATEDARYSGKYCENCPTCMGRCNELRDCVQCQMYKTGPLKDKDACDTNCTTFSTTGVEKVVVNGRKDEYACLFYDDDDCKFTFKYLDKNDDKIWVHAQQERECPPKVFLMGIIFGVIAATVLVGLTVLLIWKLVTTIHDRREFAQFEKERMSAKWDSGGNPIFKGAISTFENPTFAER